MKTLYVWVDSRYPESDLVYAVSPDATLELERIEVQVEEEQSLIQAVKNKLEEMK